MSKKSRKKVGKDTGETTKAGRPIYETKTGERRSEYSYTIQLNNGKWINIPSIHNGHYYTERELKEAVEDNRMIPTSEHKSEKEALLAAKKRSKGLNKGGAMEKQMELFNMGGLPEMPPQTSNMSSGTFLFAEGGMADDGGEKDPVSGNDVPSGSLAEEVRDDVPAMVSEGEFIFPADVTRFIGLNKLMELRQDAKMGLKKMEAMGQLGNPEDAELPDDIPFDMADIIIMDDEAAIDEENLKQDEMNMGGLLGYAKGGDTKGPPDLGGEPGPLTVIDPEMGGSQPSGYFDIQKEANKQYARRYVYYKNEATGETRKILADFRGNALEPIPAGFKVMLNEDGSPMTVLPKKEEEGTKAPEVKPQQGQRDDDDGPEPETFYSSEYLAEKFKGDVILDKNGNPRSMTEQGYNAVLTSANRLGLDANTYFNLPMGAKMDMLGQEFAGMFGKEVDQDYIDNIVKQVQAGEYKSKGLFGFLGGIGDWISGWFGDSDAEDTQKKIKVAQDSKKQNKNWWDKKPKKEIGTAGRDIGTGYGTYKGPSLTDTQKSFTKRYDTSSGGKMDVIDLSKRANQRNAPGNVGGAAKTDFSKGKTRVYRDDSGKAAYTKEAIDASKDLNKKNVSYAKKQEKKDPATKGGSEYTVGAKGMLVSKPNRKKPTTQRKTLIQKKS